MSLFDYRWSQQLELKDPPFYGLVMALCRKADGTNLAKLRLMWPEVVAEFERRYHAPGGLIEGEILGNVVPPPATVSYAELVDRLERAEAAIWEIAHHRLDGDTAVATARAALMPAPKEGA